MGIVETIQNLFGASPERQGNTSQPDIRYADPSHAQMNELIKSGANVKQPPVPETTNRPKRQSSKPAPPAITFDPDEIAKFVLQYLKKPEYKNGAKHTKMTNYIWACVKGNLRKRPPSFKPAMQEALNKLKAEKKIGFNEKKRLWKLRVKSKKVKLHPLSEKEIAYFKREGLGEGWYRLNDKKTGRDAIKWLHQNYSWEEFETFCCHMLEHCGVRDTEISERHPITGADGGIDGYGTYHLDGEDVRVSFQAKRYNPKYLLGVEHARNFTASTQAKDVDYGFLIATCDLTPDAREHIEAITNNKRLPTEIEIIDQTRLIECMIHRANSVHGYGLHKTDDLGIYYFNPNMLKQFS